MSYEIPTRPWKMVSQDLFTYKQSDFLVTVDFYSDYWELDHLPDTTSHSVIKCSKAHFARHGIPDTVLTDNGPQFRSQEYEQFSQQWEFNHTTSSPYHSQGNGKAESAVKIAKRIVKKTRHEGSDLQLAILAWRNTPTNGSCYSPVQKLQSRRSRTLLPTPEILLLPQVPTKVQDEIKLKKQKAKL